MVVSDELEQQRMAMLAAIIDSSEDAIVSKRLDGIITSWNKSAERIFGYTEREIVGKHISMIIPPDRMEEEADIIRMMKAGQKTGHFETVRIRKGGMPIELSISVSPIRNAAGEIIGASKIARDITLQKQAEQAMRRYTERLEVINDTGRAIAAELNANNILQKVTDATTRLSGAAFGAFFYNKTDAAGEIYTLFTIAGASRAAFEKLGMPRNTAVFSKTFSGEGPFRSPDITRDPRYGHNAPHKGMPEGHLPVVSYLAVPVLSASGLVIGGLFFGHPQPNRFDEEHEKLVVAIASLAGIALEKAKLYEEVQTLNERKDEFIGFASHELKTPLTTLKGYLQLAERAPAAMPELVPKLNKQVDRLNAIISDLLDLSKISGGALDFHFVPSSLHALLRDAAEMIRAGTGTHEIELELTRDDVWIPMDAPKMGQVLTNLLSNAVKFSPQAGRVKMSMEKFGDRVRIAVQDWGPGIPEEHGEKIFSRFYRIDRERNRTPGLGLGLYLSREIVTAHHGRIWVESEPGVGSVFHVELPLGSNG